MDPDAQLESLIGGRSAGATAPLIVTAWSPEQTRRWPVLLASTGLRIARPGEELRDGDLPAIHVHIEPYDAWLTRVCPAEDHAAFEESLKRWWWSADAWLERTGRRSEDVERFEGYARMLSGLFNLGWGPVGEPGNVKWLEFTDRAQPLDWRIVADAIAAAVRAG